MLLASASVYVSLSQAPSASPRPPTNSTGLRLRRHPFQIVHARDSVLTAYHATPAHALRMHLALRSRHSLAMHFATFAGSDVEALDPIIELEQAKRETVLLSADGDNSAVDVQRIITTAAVGVGDWWMEGGMGVIDVGETAIVQVGESEPVGRVCLTVE